jgi:hypothetical protein
MTRTTPHTAESCGSECGHDGRADSPAVGMGLSPGSAVWRHHVVREFDEHSCAEW